MFTIKNKIIMDLLHVIAVVVLIVLGVIIFKNKQNKD
jgi:hypothetical protein